MLAYSARNRSASCRIPWVSNPKARRIEIRFPDPIQSGYLTFAALMMAGLDGIKNQIDPGAPSDKDLYDLPPEGEKNIPQVCHSLDQALEALDKDRDFLKAGGVFTDDFIDGYIALKMQEVTKFRAATTRSNTRCTTRSDTRGQARPRCAAGTGDPRATERRPPQQGREAHGTARGTGRCRRSRGAGRTTRHASAAPMTGEGFHLDEEPASCRPISVPWGTPQGRAAHARGPVLRLHGRGHQRARRHHR